MSITTEIVDIHTSVVPSLGFSVVGASHNIECLLPPVLEKVTVPSV